MREYRHARLGLDARDEAFAAARHDHVDAAVQSAQQEPDRRTVARRHQRDRGFRQSRLAQSLRQALMDRAARAKTVRAAAQDHGVAGLQAKHAGIGADIGAALKDHGDHAERHAHAFDGHAVGALPALGDLAHGIVDPAHHLDAIGHRIDARGRQRETIDEGGGGAARARLGDIFSIGRENRSRIGADRARHRLERLIFLLRRRKTEHARGSARARCKVTHQGRQIG